MKIVFVTPELPLSPRWAGSPMSLRLNGVATYFIESEDYFEGRAIYGESGRDYDDNPFRFAFFSLAALAATEALGLRPDVIHVHDWQTALLPVYQRLEERPSWKGDALSSSITGGRRS